MRHTILHVTANRALVATYVPPEPLASVEPARRDRPLDFHWRVPADAAAAAGIEASGDRLLDRAARSMMAALVLAFSDNEGWVSYSRRRTWYQGQGRYQGLAYTYDRIIRIVDQLLELGLVEEQRALPGDHRRTQLQSRLRATPKLVEAFAGVRFEHDAFDPIRLRNERGEQIDYSDTDATHRMRRDMQRLNASLAGVKLELPGEGIEIDGHLLRVDGAVVRMTDAPQLYRVFSRGSFSKGGRIYWWGQNLPASRRADLLIDGESVVELDYASLHPRMLYARRGAKLIADPYAVAAFPRKRAKRALLVALNAPTKSKAVAALLASTDGDGTAWPYGWTETRSLVDAVIERNPLIAGDICSDVGIDLMRDDADIAMRVLKACAKAGIVCLPVHDSFIVQARHQAALQEIMDREIVRYEASFEVPEIASISPMVTPCNESVIRPGIPQMGKGVGGGFRGWFRSFKPVLPSPASPVRSRSLPGRVGRLASAVSSPCRKSTGTGSTQAWPPSGMVPRRIMSLPLARLKRCS